MTESRTYFCSVMHCCMTVMPAVLASLPASWPAYWGMEERGASVAPNLCAAEHVVQAKAMPALCMWVFKSIKL